MSSPNVITLADIPTITQLYESSSLQPQANSQPKYPPSESINQRVSLIRADITTLQLDAIVNAANTSLRGGGGVDGAIHQAAGRHLLQELTQKFPNGCSVGDAALTNAYNLPSKYIIHTAGPIYQNRQASEPLLRRAYLNSLTAADSNNCTTLAFSGLSTGVYGYPSNEAAHIACEEVRKYLESDAAGGLGRVVFVVFLSKDVNAYKAIIPQYFPPAEGEA